MSIPHSICIPTCKSEGEISKLIEDIKIFSTGDYELIFSCVKASASVNRNVCLDKSTRDVLIMIDDDITGFFKGWNEVLTKTIIDDPNCAIVSARLLKNDRGLGFMLSNNYDLSKPLVIVGSVPTAAIAFIRDKDIRFDENFIGSGFEDDDFRYQMRIKYPDKYCMINNDCKIVHTNEMKNQKGKYWDHNKAYFLKKYPQEIDRWHD